MIRVTILKSDFTYEEHYPIAAVTSSLTRGKFSMPNNKLNDLALYYCVDDLPGALIPATRLTTILERCHQSLSLTRLALVYLEKQGLKALHQHAQGNSAIDEFRRSAKEEQLQRKQTAEIMQRTLEAARQAQINLMQEKARAARQALDSDPKYIAKVRNQKLRAHYYLDYFIERDCFHTLMDILRRLDAGNRLTDKDILWLSTTGKDYYSDHLKSAYHCIEAKFYANQFKKLQDPWMAINASSHYRKANKPAVADKLLCTIDIEKKKSPKIKSAFYTTHGGVMIWQDFSGHISKQLFYMLHRIPLELRNQWLNVFSGGYKTPQYIQIWPA